MFKNRNKDTLVAVWKRRCQEAAQSNMQAIDHTFGK
jgi:hypothetical protein